MSFAAWSVPWSRPNSLSTRLATYFQPVPPSFASEGLCAIGDLLGVVLWWAGGARWGPLAPRGRAHGARTLRAALCHVGRARPMLAGGGATGRSGGRGRAPSAPSSTIVRPTGHDMPGRDYSDEHPGL
ncbi:hypothetical protein GCM10027268_21750 [Brachybacterium huguangmaarense]